MIILIQYLISTVQDRTNMVYLARPEQSLSLMLGESAVKLFSPERDAVLSQWVY